MRSLTICAFAILFSSCSAGSSNNETELEYFGLKNLIQEQINLLSSGKYQLRKSATLNEINETEVLIPDSLGWSDELKFFWNADLNLPNLKGAYELVEGPGENSSNLKEAIYKPLREIPMGVQYLKILYVEDIKDLRKVEIQLGESNQLYQSQSILKLELERNGQDRLVLQNYEIIGGQKMIMMDSVTYRITGDITSL